VLKLLRRADSLLAYMISSCFTVILTNSLYLTSVLIGVFTTCFAITEMIMDFLPALLGQCLMKGQCHLDAINQSILELPQVLYYDQNMIHRGNGPWQFRSFARADNPGRCQNNAKIDINIGPRYIVLHSSLSPLASGRAPSASNPVPHCFANPRRSSY
jgi:hypothetical protein